MENLTGFTTEQAEEMGLEYSDLAELVGTLAKTLSEKEQRLEQQQQIIDKMATKEKFLREAKDEMISISTEYLAMFQGSLSEFSTAFDLKYQEPDELDLLLTEKN